MSLPHQMTGDYVKLHGPSVEDDWRRVCSLAEACDTLDGVKTARPLWIDRDRRCIGYEFVDGLIPVLRPGLGLYERFYQVGASIARLHQTTQAKSGEGESYPLASFGLSSEDCGLMSNLIPFGLFHGDCAHGNVFNHASGELIILDPLPHESMFQRNFYFACGALDLAMMHMSIFMAHSAATHLRKGIAPFVPASQGVLDGYLETTDAVATKPAVLRLSRRIAQRHIAGYHRRLSPPIAIVKTGIGKLLLHQLDRELHWGDG